MHKGGEGAGNGGKETIKKKSNGKQNEVILYWSFDVIGVGVHRICAADGC